MLAVRVTLVILLLTNAWCLTSSQATLNGDPNSSLVDHINRLEQSLSDLSSESKAQEQKYAAVLSNVLSKLTTTSDELTALKTNHTATSDELASLKDNHTKTVIELNTKVTKTEEELKHVTETIERNITSCSNALSNVLSKLTITSNELATLETELQATAAEMATVKSNQVNLQQDSETAKGNISSCVNGLRNVRGDVRTLNNTSHLSQTSIMTLESRMDNVKSDVKESETHVNQSLTVALFDITKLQSEHHASQQDLTSLAAQQSSLSKDLENTKQDVIRTTTSLHQLNISNNLSQGQHNGNNVAFQVTQAGANVAWTTLMFGSVDLNDGNGYSKATGIFTAPESGTYILWANVVLKRTRGAHSIELYKGKDKIAVGPTFPHSVHGTQGRDPVDEYELASIMTVIHLNKNDEIHFDVAPRGTTSGQRRSSYGGALLHNN